MSEVKRYSAQPFSPSGLMFENEFGHYVLFCEYEKLKAELKQVIEIGVEGQREINRKAHAEITKLTLQRDILKKCAEFYANMETYYVNGRSDLKNHIVDSDLEQILYHYSHIELLEWIGGKTARKALQEAEQE
jgi:hypothetical protein